MATHLITPVRDPTGLAAAGSLFRAYADSLPVSLAYQDFDAELATLPGQYAPPAGTLLLAWAPAGQAVGCAALRPLPPLGTCEMKRLFVTPAARGTGLGFALATAVQEAAVRLGYQTILLDTLPSMTAAQAMYRKLGFQETAPYYPSAVPGTLFMRRDLTAA